MLLLMLVLMRLLIPMLLRVLLRVLLWAVMRLLVLVLECHVWPCYAPMTSGNGAWHIKIQGGNLAAMQALSERPPQHRYKAQMAACESKHVMATAMTTWGQIH